MIQYIIVAIIILFAVVLAAKRIWDSFHGKVDCGCGCGEHCPNKGKYCQ